MNPNSIIKKLGFATALALAINVTDASPRNLDINSASTPRDLSAPSESPDGRQSIMLALLLDTSNSMDGLIDQAKSQLWKIVNELAAAKCDDRSRPTIKIALYEYGNSGLPSTLGYIRQVSALTDDLDLISEKLFALRTNGGDEYCGQVIKTSLDELEWSASNADLKLIFIAGNEPFTQGAVQYRTACALARERDVVVNTIFCGPYGEGVETDWKNGATITGGTYMAIEQDRKTVYIATPYDDKIDALNNRLNDTYVYYGSTGAKKKEMQAQQDSNAESYGKANKAERAISKSGHAYSNKSWDLVDASKDDAKVIEQAKEEELPSAMKGMTPAQRKEYVSKKSEERKSIQKEIQELSVKRQAYIVEHTPKEEKDAMLDAVMIKSIKERAKSKNLSWEK
ncbi:MAG TPA: vWA domain-containing protein [Cyclobacteriaceae bacterium]|nr:vWA domain-containing protein [Cyclobacteriaceae bacterium]